MNPDVFSLIIIDVDCDFRFGLALWYLDVGLNDVVLCAGRDPLRELAPAVGDKLPLKLLVSGAADLDGNVADRMTTGVPHRAVDQRIVLRRGRGG